MYVLVINFVAETCHPDSGSKFLTRLQNSNPTLLYPQ